MIMSSSYQGLTPDLAVYKKHIADLNGKLGVLYHVIQFATPHDSWPLWQIFNLPEPSGYCDMEKIPPFGMTGDFFCRS